MIDLALEVAARAHKDQVRNGTDISYITHPCAVALILSRCGCADELLAAGLLHDTVEDTDITLDYIRHHFGDKVASIVAGCSEPDKSLPWEERKRHTLEYLRTAPLEVRLVACADKLHNIRTIASEYGKIGDKVWERFKRGKGEQEWYYRGLVDSLRHSLDAGEQPALFRLLEKEVESLFSG